MAYSQSYGGVIWTNHAIQRMQERGLPQEWALQAFQHADRSSPSKDGGMEFQKRIEQFRVTVIAKRNERYEWVIISCWMDPPQYGTKDYKKREAYQKYQKAGFWGKLWHILKQQLGF